MKKYQIMFALAAATAVGGPVGAAPRIHYYPVDGKIEIINDHIGPLANFTVQSPSGLGLKADGANFMQKIPGAIRDFGEFPVAFTYINLPVGTHNVGLVGVAGQTLRNTDLLYEYRLNSLMDPLIRRWVGGNEPSTPYALYFANGRIEIVNNTSGPLASATVGGAGLQAGGVHLRKITGTTIDVTEFPFDFTYFNLPVGTHFVGEVPQHLLNPNLTAPDFPLTFHYRTDALTGPLIRGQFNLIPEPATLSTSALGLIGVVALDRRRKPVWSA